MTGKKKIEELEVSEETPEEVVEEPEEEKVKSLKIASVYKGTSLVREYSLEVHGKGYKALAEEFVEKNNKPELKIRYEVRLK